MNYSGTGRGPGRMMVCVSAQPWCLTQLSEEKKGTALPLANFVDLVGYIS